MGIRHCIVCGKPIYIPPKFARAKWARCPECKPEDSKSKSSWNGLVWGVINRLLELIRSSAKPLLAGSAGFGAAWGFFEYGSILGVIGGAITFPCLLCGLFTVPAAFFWIAWGTWDGFKSLIRWLDRVLDPPEIHEEQISKTQAVPHGWAEEMLAYVTDERDIYLLKRVIHEGSNYRSSSRGEHWYLGSLRARYRKIKGVD